MKIRRADRRQRPATAYAELRPKWMFAYEVNRTAFVVEIAFVALVDQPGNTYTPPRPVWTWPYPEGPVTPWEPNPPIVTIPGHQIPSTRNRILTFQDWWFANATTRNKITARFQPAGSLDADEFPLIPANYTGIRTNQGHRVAPGPVLPAAYAADLPPDLPTS